MAETYTENRTQLVEDSIPAFFESVTGPHPQLPKTISGTLRFDLDTDEHWRLTFDKGVVSATRSNATADCVCRMDKKTMEAIIQGKTNAMAALLRGAIQAEGQLLLLGLFRDILTVPEAKPTTQRPGKFTGSRP